MADQSVQEEKYLTFRPMTGYFVAKWFSLPVFIFLQYFVFTILPIMYNNNIIAMFWHQMSGRPDILNEYLTEST